MMKDGNPKAILLQDYLAPDYRIERVALCFKLYAEKTVVESKIDFVASDLEAAVRPPLVLHGEQLKLKQVMLDGVSLSGDAYQQTDEQLKIEQVPAQFTLQTQVEIDPASNTALEGLYLSAGNYCTQCEAEGFRKITYYLDRPDVMAIFSVRIEADAKAFPVLLSNGNRIQQGELAEGRHFAEWHDPFPKPSYLFALVAGDLSCNSATFKTMSGRVIDLEVYTEAHNADKCEHALLSLQKAMAWDEKTYALEYDLDTYMIVAVDDFNMGAMENKGLNVFNSKCVLASPETATDADYMTIEAVIAHEYFHNWTGNRVTCRDWFQLSLKEGLTVFRDQEFTSDMTSRAVKRIQDVRFFRTHQFAEDASPMAHPIRPASYVEINNFYTLTVYEKGAEVVRMYQTLFGKAGFKRGLKRYFEKHDGEAVTTDDFAQAMAEANATDLSDFMPWYSQFGTPTIKVESIYDAQAQTYTLQFEQQLVSNTQQPQPQAQLTPVSIALLDAHGKVMPLSLLDSDVGPKAEMTLQLNKISQQFCFQKISEEPTPSLLRGYSAPVKLDYNYSDADYAFLMANDNDSFNRWEAGQQFAVSCILRSIKAIQSAQEPPQHEDFCKALANFFAQQAEADPAYVAEMMILPPETYLAELMTPIDVDAIYQARKLLQAAIAEKLEASLLSCVQQHMKTSRNKSYDYNAVEMGQRRLVAVCLSYLCVLDKAQYHQLAADYFAAANNMTASMSALDALNDVDCDQRQQTLDSFAQRWQGDTLVMDKWFSLQARARTADALQVVQGLMQHPAFAMTNPNKVRALIGSFSMANPTTFHAKDGSGYRFLADQVIALNAINPQVAARLLKPLISWHKYDSQRQALMCTELRRIHDTEGLSSDVFELVDRGLAQ
jgi:aminopeptidase N|tara:strand:+ start:9459 stop:12122 length:2664 start_codon:yes stop_codon:yes gene_type:complete